MNPAKSFIHRIFFVSAFSFLAIICVFSGLYLNVREDLPRLPQNLKNIYLKPPTEIYSSDGVLLKVLGERLIVDLDSISPHFQKAIIAVEDVRFYEHGGLDPISLARALLANLRGGRKVQGGSTLTQQLSKNLFFSFEKTWGRKFKELLMALQMEVTFTKNEILEAYCNQVYFGNGVYGVEEASRLYMGKMAKDLTLLEAAMLAGIPNSPNAFNPFKNYDRAFRRTQLVLNRMVKSGSITEAEKNEALESKVVLQTRKNSSNPDSYFIDHVMGQMEGKYGKDFVHFGGLKIFTTLDTVSQVRAHKAANRNLKFLEGKLAKTDTKESLEVALVCIENGTGAVRVLLGGRNHSQSQFNRAISNNRMPGSSFKPFIYMSAMQNLGYSPATVMVDEPVMLNIPGSPRWVPKNYNEKYFGPIVLKTALAKSLNIISVKMMHRLTPQKVIATARKFGITSPLGKNYSLALGTSGVSPLELASAYSVIANLGIHKKPFLVEKIESYDGKVLFKKLIHKVQRFSPDEIYPLLDMMQGVVERGSGQVIRKIGFDHPAAGKTGTTNDFKDGWFTGFVKEFTTSVWVGFDSNESMMSSQGKGITGSHAAAPIWALFMKDQMKGKEKSSFSIPPGIKFATINSKTGFLAGDESDQDIRVAVREALDIPLRPSADTESQNKKFEEPVAAAPKNFQPVPVAENHEKRVEEPKSPGGELRMENESLDSKIWFMRNLDNASMGQVANIPVSWYVNLLEETNRPDFDDISRLSQGRKNVIEHVLNQVGSIDAKILGGLKLRDVLMPSEIKVHGGQEGE